MSYPLGPEPPFELIRETAEGLMKLQRRRKLYVWVDGWIFYVSPFEARFPFATRRKITLETAHEIIKAGNLTPIMDVPRKPMLFAKAESAKRIRLMRRYRTA